MNDSSHLCRSIIVCTCPFCVISRSTIIRLQLYIHAHLYNYSYEEGFMIIGNASQLIHILSSSSRNNQFSAVSIIFLIDYNSNYNIIYTL